MIEIQRARDKAAFENRRRFTPEEIEMAIAIFKSVRPGIWEILKLSFTLDEGGLEFGYPAGISAAQTMALRQMPFVDYKTLHYQSERELFRAISDAARKEAAKGIV